MDPKNTHALHNRGISYERLSRYKDAIKDFSKVIQIDPENANAYFNRGCCYDSTGEIDLAISDYSVALELDLKTGGEDQQNQDENQKHEQDADEEPENVQETNRYHHN